MNKIIDLTERGDFENIYFFSFIFSIIVGLIKKNKSPLICPAGTELAVSPSGDLFPCFMLINKNDDFLLKRFDDKFVEQKFIDKLTKFMYKNIKSANNECRDCYARYLCHGCVGSNYNVNDDIGINERMNCLLMQSIVKEAILKIATISLDSNRWSNFVTNMGKILNTTKRTESAC